MHFAFPGLFLFAVFAKKADMWYNNKTQAPTGVRLKKLKFLEK